MAKKVVSIKEPSPQKEFSQGELVVFKKKGTTTPILGKFLCRMATNIIWVQDNHGRKFYLQEGDLCERYVENAIPAPKPFQQKNK